MRTTGKVTSDQRRGRRSTNTRQRQRVTTIPCKLKAAKVVLAVADDVLGRTDAMTVRVLTDDIRIDEVRCSTGSDKPTEIASVGSSAKDEQEKTWAAIFPDETAGATSRGADRLHCLLCVVVRHRYRVARRLGRAKCPSAMTASSSLALSTPILFKCRALAKCACVARRDLMAFPDAMPRFFTRSIHV